MLVLNLITVVSVCTRKCWQVYFLCGFSVSKKLMESLMESLRFQTSVCVDLCYNFLKLIWLIEVLERLFCSIRSRV